MSSVAAHRLMLPSSWLAAIDEGNSNNARLEAPFDNTITCMDFDVLDFLCLWGGCDVYLPPHWGSPAAIGGISHQRRKPPRTSSANDFASDNSWHAARWCAFPVSLQLFFRLLRWHQSTVKLQRFDFQAAPRRHSVSRCFLLLFAPS